MSNTQERSSFSILLSLFFSVLIDMLGVGIVIVVMAPYIKESPNLFSFETTDNFRNAVYLSLIAVLGAAQFIGAPLFGSLSDEYGRKRMVIASMVGGAFGYLLFTLGVLQSQIWLLFLGRFISGFCSGGISIMYSIIADLSSTEDRARNFGLLGSAFGIGFVLGPVLGALLANDEIMPWFNESTPFFTAMFLSLLSAALLWLTIPETNKSASKGDITIHWLQGIHNIQRAFELKELQLIFIVLFLVYLGFTFFTQFAPVYLIDNLDFSDNQLGVFFSLIGLSLFITQAILLSLFTKRNSPRKIVRIVLFSLAASLLIFLMPRNYNQILWISPLIPFSFGLLQPNLLSIISNAAPDHHQGEILGIQQSIRSLGYTLPPLLSIFLSKLEIRLPIVIGSCVILIAALVFTTNYSNFKLKIKPNTDEDVSH